MPRAARAVAAVTDMPPLRLVIIFVGSTLLLSMALIGVLALDGKPIPDVLQNMAVGSLAALTALLVPTRSQGEAGQ